MQKVYSISFANALLWLDQCQWDKALASLVHSLRDPSSDRDEVNSLLAWVLLRSGHTRASRVYLGRCSINPSSLYYWRVKLRLDLEQFDSGDFESDFKLAAARYDPIDILDLKSEYYYLRGESDRALKLLDPYVYSSPNHRVPLQAALVLLRSAKKHSKVRHILGSIVARFSASVDALIQVASAYASLGDLSSAIQALEVAAQLAPCNAFIVSRIGILNYDIANDAEARKWFIRAVELEPRRLSHLLNSSSYLSRVAMSSSEIESSVRLLESAVKKALFSKYLPKILPGENDLLPYAYALAYSSANIRQAIEKLNSLLLQRSKTTLSLIEKAHHKGTFLSHLDALKVASARADARIKIAFISRNFFSHSHLEAFEGLIRYLDPTKFCKIILHLPGVKVDDHNHRVVNSYADYFFYLSPGPSVQAAEARTLGLDVAFFTDIGMQTNDIFLPACRIAKHQLCGWGVPFTSGLREIDYYISSSYLESEDADKHYTEKLVRLNSLPCSFLSKAIQSPCRDRSFFLLPDDAILIGCIQTLWKIHPDMDGVIQAIALAIPSAYFVFIASGRDDVDMLFAERIGKCGDAVCDRLILVNRVAAKDVPSLCNCFDIMLDTLYFGGGITHFYALAAGTPVVGFRNKYARGRMLLAMYKYLDISFDLIADNTSRCVEICKWLILNPEFRKQLKSEISFKASRMLYDNRKYADELSLFLEDLCVSL